MTKIKERADRWSHKIIGAAVEVHKQMGPGLLESIYEKCMMLECKSQSIPYVNQKPINLKYKETLLEESFRLDLIIDDCLIVEIKAVENILPIHKAQLFSYMKLLNVSVGLLINFHEEKVINGIHRLYLSSTKQ